jgi:integrase/recombinase XerD
MKSTKKLPYEIKILLNFLDQEGLDLKDINYKRVQEYRTYLVTLQNKDGAMHYSGAMVFDLLNTARCFYDYLKMKGVVISNPFIGIKHLKIVKKLPRHIPDEEGMERLLEKFRCFWKEKEIRQRRKLYKIHVIAELMYATGLRLSEVTALKASDIRLEEKTVLVRHGKGDKERIAYLTEYAVQVLGIYINDMRKYVNREKKNRNLFGVANGKNLASMLNTWLKQLGAECGIERFTSHTFRHALGFHLLRRGCDMRYIQLILGHECMGTTSIYTKVDKSDLRRELDTYHPRQLQRNGKKQGAGQ